LRVPQEWDFDFGFLVAVVAPVCVEAGKQVDTGVNYVPMGKSTFFVSHCPFSLLQCSLGELVV
jgi:hypothetical protein